MPGYLYIALRTPRRSRRRPTGVTLIELLIAMSLAGMVTLALTHVVRQLSIAVCSLQSSADRQTETSLAVLRMRSELGEALHVISVSPAQITFCHPDVTGDGAMDLVSYAWTGAGSAITRQVNGGVIDGLLQNCHSLSITASTQPRTTEELLACHCMYAGVPTSAQQPSVSSTTWQAEVFTPARPGAATFRVTRVRIWLRLLASTALVTVDVRPTVANAPATTSLASATCSLAPMNSNGGWESFDFNYTSGTAIGLPVAIVVRANTTTAAVAAACDQIVSGAPPSSSDFYRYSTDGGTSWLPSSNLAAADLRYYVYGRFYSSTGAALPVGNGPMSLVGLHVESGTDSSACRLDTAVQCVNWPEIGG